MTYWMESYQRVQQVQRRQPVDLLVYQPSMLRPFLNCNAVLDRDKFIVEAGSLRQMDAVQFG